MSKINKDIVVKAIKSTKDSDFLHSIHVVPETAHLVINNLATRPDTLHEIAKKFPHLAPNLIDNPNTPSEALHHIASELISNPGQEHSHALSDAVLRMTGNHDDYDNVPHKNLSRATSEMFKDALKDSKFLGSAPEFSLMLSKRPDTTSDTIHHIASNWATDNNSRNSEILTRAVANLFGRHEWERRGPYAEGVMQNIGKAHSNLSSATRDLVSRALSYHYDKVHDASRQEQLLVNDHLLKTQATRYKPDHIPYDFSNHDSLIRRRNLLDWIEYKLKHSSRESSW